MTINLNLSTLAKWLPAIIPALIAAYHSAYPQIQVWVSHHPSTAIYISTASVFIATLLKSPLVASTPTATTLSAAIAQAKKG